MDKGIWVGHAFDFYNDMPFFVEKGFTAAYIPSTGGPDEQKQKADYARSCGIKILITDIRDDTYWKETVNKVDSEIYYQDEPYLYKYPEKQLLEKLYYVRLNRPNSKFVIGDIRIIQNNDYQPIREMYYTYSSYTDNWKLPFIGAIPIGLGNQSPSIKRIYKKMQGRMPFIWVYGQNKLLCHPDEYHKLRKTCDELGINLMMLYLGDGHGKYKFNAVTREEHLEYIEHFMNDTKPYTTREWWQRLYYRLKLSIVDFIDHLF